MYVVELPFLLGAPPRKRAKRFLRRSSALQYAHRIAAEPIHPTIVVYRVSLTRGTVDAALILSPITSA